MSCGKVQNPPGFTLCRVAKSKTRRVSRYVVWQSPKPAGFYAMSCGKVQNLTGFAPCRVAQPKTRRGGLRAPAKFYLVPGKNFPTPAGKFFPGTFLRPITYPANFPGLGEALIFFCLLFLYQGKAPAGAAKFAGYMNGLVPGKLPCPGRGRMQYAPTRTRAICFWILDNCRLKSLPLIGRHASASFLRTS